MQDIIIIYDESCIVTLIVKLIDDDIIKHIEKTLDLINT